MSVHERAGQPARAADLVNLPRLVTAYYTSRPDMDVAEQRVSFGTSGHRGSSFKSSFTESHILAITQAICDFRKQQGIDGPLMMGMDSHPLSEPALATALEVLAGNGVETLIDAHYDYSPTPAISHSILNYNVGRSSGLADGVLITPSHNPPEDGGFKYNPPHGGPAGSDATGPIQNRANEILTSGLKEVRRMAFPAALKAGTTHRKDFIAEYTADLELVIDFEAIRASGVKLGVDPLGGASVHYWAPIRDRYGLNLTIVNEGVEPDFRFMTLDWDGRIRMDPSSPYAMRSLIEMKSRFDVAFACDTDADRHGIVAASVGLLPPNHYLAVCVDYLFRNRPRWRADAGVGKTLVSSSMIDRVAARLGRRLFEVPVGFKFFVNGLLDGSLGFGGEESAGACFLRRDGKTWCTDKDGLILALLAAEITARSGKDPGELYRDLTRELGDPVYERIDAPANLQQKDKLSRLSPSNLKAAELAGEKVEAILTEAPGDGNKVGGVKVVTPSGWFAARPSGTEDVYKIYAESFRSVEHLRKLQTEARQIVNAAIA